MPVALLRDNGAPGFAPVARPRFFLGRDLDCDLVDASDGVASIHATIRYRRGEFLLKAEEGCSLWVGAERVPFLTLRDGDAVRLAPNAEPWRFRSRVEGSFWPPELQVGEAWLSHPAYHDPEHGPSRFGEGPPVGGVDPLHCRLVSTPYGPWIVKNLAPIREPLAANEHLRFLAALGGAPHPSLAPLVDGGIAPRDGEPWRWMATRLVEGTSAERVVEKGDATAWQVLQTLRQLSEALRHLHHRGIVHRAVAPENVILSEKGPAVLIDYGFAWSSENEVRDAVAREDSPWLAPDLRRASGEGSGGGTPGPAEDVYGLAAVGFALLTGAPPARGEDIRATLIRARREQPARWRLDVDAARVLIGVIQAGLSEDPGERPDAAECTRTLAFGVAHAAVGALR
jgi:hypothetical protein